MTKSIPTDSILSAQAAPVGCRGEETTEHGEKVPGSRAFCFCHCRQQYLCATTMGNCGSSLLKGHKGPERQQRRVMQVGSKCGKPAPISPSRRKGNKLSSKQLTALCRQLTLSLQLFTLGKFANLFVLSLKCSQVLAMYLVSKEIRAVPKKFWWPLASVLYVQ